MRFKFNIVRFGRTGLARLTGLAFVVLTSSAAGAWDGSASTGLSAPQTAGSCVTRKTAYKMATDTVSTSEVSFAKVPGTKVKFTQGGSGRGCVIVKISATTYAPDGVVFIRARVGGIVAEQDEVLFKGSDDYAYGAHTFTFVFPRVKPGKSAAVIQWLSSSGSSVFMLDRTVLVEHR